MSKTLGQKIKHIRGLEGLSQQKMADLVDIPKVTLQNYERGVRTVHESNLLKITNHPQFRKYALMLVTDEPERAEAEQVEPLPLNSFSDLLDKLTAQQLDQLFEYTQFLISKNSKRDE